MATKTITIDLEAYEALRRRKGKGDSFSDVIKAHFQEGVTGTELEHLLGDVMLSEEALARLDAVVASRSENLALPVDL